MLFLGVLRFELFFGVVLIKKEDGIERIEGSANSLSSSFGTHFLVMLIKKRMNRERK